MIDSLEILKENNHIDCSNKLLDLISSEINDSEKYSLGLSGGSTPKFFYELFAKKYKNYSNIYLWTVDERHVDIDDEKSNQRMINSIFSNSNLNIIEYSYEEDPGHSAKNYTTKVFSKFDKFNAAILGVGEDGHIASLFPDTTALNADEKGFVHNEVNILTKWRVTSTFELLKNVEHVYLLVTGDNKKGIIEKIGKENDLPVNELIRLRKKTVLLTDQ
uniref:6-phosphogluconolactonase/glucosamine-6-phosphate isomerase/deaminase n=1 Tax=Candidatus Actinomarina minuta TaxID=1389454 RepID=S5DP81_9ACTN|nr:6-phosphogluconolactonase/glucosamine-6- phosphate isomerase/deaminase [Candidatus Actinomarina minuta]